MRLLPLILLLLGTLTATAQIQKGDRLLRLESSASPGTVGSGGNLLRLAYYPSNSYGVVNGSVSYGFALTDRFVLGARVSGYQTFGEDPQFPVANDGSVRINPYARYYLINRASSMVFGELATGATLASGSGGRVADDFRAGVGMSLPITSGVLATPRLDYNFGDGLNIVALALHLEFVLGRNTRSEDAPVASFGKGSLMLGGQSAGLSVLRDGSAGGLAVGGSYFLTDRLTLAAGLLLNGSSYAPETFNLPNSDFKSRTIQFGPELGSRYYITTSRRLVYFGEVGIGYMYGKTSFTGSNFSSEATSSYFTVSAGVGAQYFIRDNFSFELGPSYQRVLDADISSSGIALRLGAQFLL